MTKERKKLSEETKKEIVAKFVSGAKTAKEVADEYGIDVNLVYRWRTLYDEEAKGLAISRLQSEYSNSELSQMVQRQQDEIEEYQKKVAEQLLIIDLLKKLRKQGILPSESELSGLIATMKKSDQKQKRAK